MRCGNPHWLHASGLKVCKLQTTTQQNNAPVPTGPVPVVDGFGNYTATPSGYGYSGRWLPPCSLRASASWLRSLVPFRLRRLDRRTQGQAEAEEGRAERLLGREAERRPATRRAVVPAAATDHAA